jgi:phosphate transport system substrate-binding protein
VKKTLIPALALSFVLPTACGGGKLELQNLGSDTMLEVAGALAEEYHKVNDEFVVSVSGGGSGVGIANLIAGDVDIANSSRPLKDKEIDQAKKQGQTPVQHKIGYDGIAIYVHKANPIASITLEQLKDLFGDGGKISKWSDLGIDLGSPNADRVVLASRQNNSGTYECFRDAVLGGESGRFKPECNNLNGSKDVVDFCAKTISAIGYSGIAYATDEVRIVPVVKAAGGKPVTPTTATVLDDSYALSRPLFMYTNGEPTGPIKTYLDWIKSDAGQRVLIKKGYIPLRLL